MDSDFWTMRLAAAKRQFSMQNNHHSQLDRFNGEDFDGEEETRPEYPCPYCYEEFDIASLCSHLEAEHSYESKSTVCPVCSVKVVGDMISHLTLQHGHLFKMQRRGRLRRVPFLNSQALSLLGRDLREAHLQVLLGGNGFRSNTAAPSTTAVADNLLSSLVLNFPSSENDGFSKSLMLSLDENSATPQHVWKSSFHSSPMSREERKKRTTQAAGRAAFVQDLLASTLLLADM